MMYLGAEGEVDLPHHVIRTAPDYERNLHDIGRAGCVSEDPSFYVCNAARTDPDLAPPGHAALYVLVPVPNTKADIDWDAETPRLRQRVLNRMRDVLGVDLAGRIRAERVVTPDDWEATNIAFGATFNLAHGVSQLLYFRPHNAFEELRNLYLVGGGTHPGKLVINDCMFGYGGKEIQRGNYEILTFSKDSTGKIPVQLETYLSKAERTFTIEGRFDGVLGVQVRPPSSLVETRATKSAP